MLKEHFISPVSLPVRRSSLPFAKKFHLDNLQWIPALNTKHQIVSLKLASALLQYVESHNLGQVLQAPFDVVLARGLIIHPDIFFIERERSGMIGERNLHGAPDLVVEVLSNETRKMDLMVKKGLYSQHGVSELWMVDPASESAEVFLWSEMGYASAGTFGRTDVLRSPGFPEFRLPLDTVFPSA